MHTDDSPIEFALREYSDADEYDLDEERIRALKTQGTEECEEGFVAGYGEDDEGIHWVQIDNVRVYANGVKELFSFLHQVCQSYVVVQVQVFTQRITESRLT